ncbi:MULTISPECIES: PH domain-containing protein [Marinimicrobium]|uniref:PH (Pleckstrin Homology) domain-containing protein n=1 Tax=Marinimicrobium koreense TaxID=306545 RepID=A0A3N1P8M4_9GAMM|nr:MULTISPECIES: PH domain-containing protein [Marinimicrobium]ROQ21076.1 PH (Pleckstrin Homology) domain-containing protein [Marinimicrobium koreense]
MSEPLYSEHPAMFKNNPIGFIVSLLLIPVFGVGLLILLWWYLQCKGSLLTVKEHDILYEQGLLSKNRAEFSISGIRTVRVNQSFFNRIFGVGTIQIFTAGDQPEIEAKGMPDPNRVRELIKARQNGGAR